ncbi:MAG: FtsX-like permease family protein [Bacteroidota bacterium]
MLFKIAWRNLWRNKRRTFITMASVFFAVLMAIFLRSIQEGVYDQMIDNSVRYYRGYVQVHQNGYWDEQFIDNTFEDSPELQQTLENEKEVRVVTPRLESPMMVSTGSNSRFSLMVGIDPAKEDQITRLKGRIVEGEYLEEGDKAIVVGVGLAEKMKLALGDTLILLGQGYHGQQSYDQYPIKGMVKFGSPELNKRMVYLPVKEAQYLLASPDRLSAYAMDVSSRRVSGKVVEQLESKLDSGTYEVMDWQEMDAELLKFIESDRAGGMVTMFILYILIGFGIFGTALMMISERKYEFGVQIAIGMKKIQLAYILIMEMVFIAVMGVLAGAIVAIPLQYFFHANPIDLGKDMAKVYESFNIEAIIPTSTDPSIIIDQAVFVLIMTLLIMIYPISKLFRIKPIEAMRG